MLGYPVLNYSVFCDCRQRTLAMNFPHPWCSVFPRFFAMILFVILSCLCSFWQIFLFIPGVLLREVLKHGCLGFLTIFVRFSSRSARLHASMVRKSDRSILWWWAVHAMGSSGHPMHKVDRKEWTKNSIRFDSGFHLPLHYECLFQAEVRIVRVELNRGALLPVSFPWRFLSIVA